MAKRARSKIRKKADRPKEPQARNSASISTTKVITINGISIDPSAPKAALAGLALNNRTAQDSDYLVVQTKQPLNRAQWIYQDPARRHSSHSASVCSGPCCRILRRWWD